MNKEKKFLESEVENIRRMTPDTAESILIDSEDQCVVWIEADRKMLEDFKDYYFILHCYSMKLYSKRKLQRIQEAFESED